jgi:GT2 family glycosyltransferase
MGRGQRGLRSAILASGLPLWAADFELSEPQEGIADGTADDGTEYTAAVLLARLHGVPLGEVAVTLPTSTQAVVDALIAQLGVDVRRPVDQVDDASVDSGSEAHSRSGAVRRDLPRRGGEGAAAAPSVSVVVATAGRPFQVARCVAALLTSAYHDFEVIVVDNDPDDRSTAIVLRPQMDGDERLRYLAEPVRGCSRARNSGIARARGDVIAFTDDDVVVDRDWLTAIARTFASDPKVACVTGLTLPYRLDTTAQRDFERVAGFSGGFQPLRFHRDMEPRPTRLFPYTAGIAGSSNNLAVRSDVLRRVGGFDVRLGPGTRVGGAEDLDLLTRVFLAGDEVRYEPSVLVRHEHRTKEGAVARQIFSYGSGATAVLMKWALTSPALRRQLASHLWSILRDLTREEVLRGASAPARETAPATGPPAARGSLRLARILGYMAGPILWLMTLARGARPT